MPRIAVLIWMFAAIVLLDSRADSQFVQLSPIHSLQYNDNNPIGAGAIDHDAFYCYWPPWSVAEPVVTAVELETGKLLWSIPAKMTAELAFELDDGWLQFESNDQDPQLPDSAIGFHIVECKTGKEIVVKSDSERYSDVIRTVVHRGRCVTPQGLVVKCEDGTIVGDLGVGSHQVLAVDGKLFSLPYETQATIADRDVCTLKRYDIETMQLEREFVLQHRFPMSFVTAKGDFVVVRCQIQPREAELVCLDLEQHQEIWRIGLPSGVYTSRSTWVDDSRFALITGQLGPVRPMLIDISSGKMTADLTWQDPRSLLNWHFNGSYFPDLFATDGERIVGRWRTQRLICIDAVTGSLIWRHSHDTYPTIRLYCQSPKMGKEIVAESENGFDIISVATSDGSRRAITPKQIGLRKYSKKPREPDSVAPTDNVGKHRASAGENQEKLIRELIRGWSVFLWPTIPLCVWIIWSLVRLRHPAPKADKHIV